MTLLTQHTQTKMCSVQQVKLPLTGTSTVYVLFINTDHPLSVVTTSLRAVRLKIKGYVFIKLEPQKSVFLHTFLHKTLRRGCYYMAGT